jgi:hypothetical protein
VSDNLAGRMAVTSYKIADGLQLDRGLDRVICIACQ